MSFADWFFISITAQHQLAALFYLWTLDYPRFFYLQSAVVIGLAVVKMK